MSVAKGRNSGATLVPVMISPETGRAVRCSAIMAPLFALRFFCVNGNG
jgi:hypothetical protein